MPRIPYPITGTITDVDGNAANEVTVIIYNLKNGDSISGKTDSNGNYLLDVANAAKDWETDDPILIRSYYPGNYFRNADAIWSIVGTSLTMNLFLENELPEHKKEVNLNHLDRREHHPTLNAKKVMEQGVISNNNSTMTPLGANEVFTGKACDILHFGVILVGIKSDVASATDGLSVQFSPDGTNWDNTDEYTIPATKGKTFSFQPVSRYMRVMYTNGSSAQGYFRMQTVLKPDYVKPSSHRIQDSIIGDDDAELVKAVLTGEDPNGVFQNVKTTEDGNLTISDNSSGLAIAKGDVTGTTFIHKFGNAPDFDQTDGAVTVWDGADDTNINQMQYPYSSSADIDSISSSEDGDTQDIEIQGLDTNYNLVSQTITLTGQTRKALDTNLIRVFRMENMGSTDFAGYVYCYVDTELSGDGVPDDATKVRAVVQNGNNQTLMAVYTIPAGKTGYMRDWYASISGANRTSNYIIRVRARSLGGVFKVKHISALVEGGSSHTQHKYEEPEVFEAKTDIEITTQMTAVAATDASISAGFDIVLIDD